MSSKFTITEWSNSYPLRCDDCGINVDLRQVIKSEWDNVNGATYYEETKCNECLDKFLENEDLKQLIGDEVLFKSYSGGTSYGIIREVNGEIFKIEGMWSGKMYEVNKENIINYKEGEI